LQDCHESGFDNTAQHHAVALLLMALAASRASSLMPFLIHARKCRTNITIRTALFVVQVKSLSEVDPLVPALKSSEVAVRLHLDMARLCLPLLSHFRHAIGMLY
jgi:hypothetical protein